MLIDQIYDPHVGKFIPKLQNDKGVLHLWGDKFKFRNPNFSSHKKKVIDIVIGYLKDWFPDDFEKVKHLIW